MPQTVVRTFPHTPLQLQLQYIYTYALKIGQKTKILLSISFVPVTPRILGIQQKQFLESCLPTAPDMESIDGWMDSSPCEPIKGSDQT